MGFELEQDVSESTLCLIRSGTSEQPSVTGQKMQLVDVDIPSSAYAKAEAFHSLYRSNDTERMELLNSIFKDLDRPKELIVMLFCKNYYPFFLNWVRSCERHGIDPRGRLIAFTLDSESAAKTEALGVKTCFLDPALYAPAGNSKVFGDLPFRSTMLYKNAIIHDALKLDASILFQDTDLVWFKDPLPYLKGNNEDCDIQIMFDGPNPRYKPVHGNSGFIYIRPNAASRALFETALRNSAVILLSGHQFPLVRIMDFFARNNLLKLNVLPEHLFLNGHLFNLKRGVLPGAGNWEEEGIVLHYSWTAHRNDKFRKLIKFGMSYLDPKDIPSDMSLDTDSDQDHKSTAAPKPTTNNSQDCTVTVYLADQDPLELICNQNSPIFRALLLALRDSELGNSHDVLIHLRLDQDDRTRDIFLRSSQISQIQVNPPLSEQTLLWLHRTPRSRFIRLLKAVKRRATSYIGK
jgi:hypothetical protein